MTSDIIKQEAMIALAIRRLIDNHRQKLSGNIRLIINFDEKNSKDWNSLVCSFLTEFSQQIDDNGKPYFCEFNFISSQFKNKKCLTATNTRFFPHFNDFVKFSKSTVDTVNCLVTFGELDCEVDDQSYIFIPITDDLIDNDENYSPLSLSSSNNSFDRQYLISSH